MITRTLLIAATALSLITMPAVAQTTKTDTETNGHHYSGGPKTESRHMGKKGAKPENPGPAALITTAAARVSPTTSGERSVGTQCQSTRDLHVSRVKRSADRLLA